MQHSPRHAFSKLGWKARTGAVIGISAGAMTLGAVLPASFASASSYGCNAQVGCATLNSHEANGNPGTSVSMDARWQQPNQIIIAYPDNKLDKATSFDKVPHKFRSGVLRGDTYYTFVYAPTGDWSNMCVTAGAGGLLSLQVCTHGNSASQQFIAGRVNASAKTITAPAVVPNFSGHAEYVLENVGSLNTSFGPNNSLPNWNVGDLHLMEVTYTGNPAALPIPHGSTAPDARQLDVNAGVNSSNTGAVTVNVGGTSHVTPTVHNGHITSVTATDVSVAQNAQWYWRT